MANKQKIYYQLWVNFAETLIDCKQQTTTTLYQCPVSDEDGRWILEHDFPYYFKSIEEIDAYIDQIELDLTENNCDTSYITITSYVTREVVHVPFKPYKKPSERKEIKKE